MNKRRDQPSNGFYSSEPIHFQIHQNKRRQKVSILSISEKSLIGPYTTDNGLAEIIQVHNKRDRNYVAFEDKYRNQDHYFLHVSVLFSNRNNRNPLPGLWPLQSGTSTIVEGRTFIILYVAPSLFHISNIPVLEAQSTELLQDLDGFYWGNLYSYYFSI